MLLVTLQCPFGVQWINLTTRPEGPSFGLRKLLRLFNLQAEIHQKKNLKMFYPPKGRLHADSSWGPNFLLIFYPPKERLLADSCRGPIVFTYVLFWVSKTLETFQFTSGNSPKKSLKMFYPPKGRLLTPLGVQLFLLMFIPRRDSAEQSPKGVQWFLLYILLV